MSNQISMVEKGIDILIATPGRLKDFCNRGIVDFTDLSIVCLDEAD